LETTLRRGPGRRRRRLQWTIALLTGAAIAGTGIALIVYNDSKPSLYRPGEEHEDVTSSLARDLPPDAPVPGLVDVTREAGLGDFRAFAGERSSQLPEDMGPGAAFGDYDDDGDDDLLLVASGARLDLPPEERAPTQLYENLGDGSFRRVASFPEPRIIGMGAAWGDADGDGRLDLVVTGYNTLILYRNRSGRLERDPLFPEPQGFWSGASFGDFDNDRDLDLYVCGYVRYVASEVGSAAHASKQYGRTVPYTLNPSSYRPERNLLFRNEGDGTFTEVGETLGVSNPEGRSLSALWHDFDDDGRLELYVANDISDNVMYYNRGGSFEDVSHPAWVADYRGAMGLAAGDWNRDGDDDLFITHWVAQENALYDSQLAGRQGQPAAAGRAALQFVDVADQRGLGQIALRVVGWGAEFLDLDADGWLDLAVANGSTFETDDVPRNLVPENSFLFWNRRGEHFHDLAPLAEPLAVAHVTRGLAVSDFDDDGDPDLLLVHRDGGAQLLRNDTPQAGRWIKIRLRSRGRDGAPTGLGDGANLVAHVRDAVLRRSVGGPSYLSQSSRTVHFGLGAAERIDRLQVLWLGGEASVHEGLEAGATWEITEGEAAARRIASTSTSAAAATGDLRARVVEFWAHQRGAMNAMKVEKDHAKAIELFRRALAIDPEHEDSIYYLANCLAREGDVVQAMAELERLITIDPGSHRAHRRIGVLRALTATSDADLEAAEAPLERAVEINPEETGALLALGEVALLRGDLDTAEQRFSWACHTNPRAAGGYFLGGYIAWKKGDEARARKLLAETRRALGKEWVPKGMTAEGDVEVAMHDDATPLSRHWEGWDGVEDPARAYARLDGDLRERRANRAMAG